ncbi:VC0807 family protein [Bdellovibrio sp. HCB337]|uniref:VC0807 family protein n=1 Tax=Bdellovibrio sp. HCB337 TaxID=3394358 RepID=UPI0039A6ECE3
MAENQKQKPENALLNILFNIVIPILILNKGSKVLGSVWGLVIALAFPLSYGIYDHIKRKKTNAISILGLLNVGITGSLALFKLHGIWFAVKEAAFPLLVGAFVFGSAFTKNPFISTLFLNPQLIDVDRLKGRLFERQTESEFGELLKKSTLWISLSFVFSAICNFVLAVRIFEPINAQLADEAQALILNEQIARMTTWSMAVIVLPSIIFLVGIFLYLTKGMQRLSGLTEDELLVQK